VVKQACPWVIAHRGVPHEAPENTLVSFEWAIQQGANWIELDIHQTADEQLVVIHDETVDRTTNGTGAVRDKTLHELQVLDAGSWMDARFQNERIPTLADVLALTEGRAGVVIEVKAGSSRYPGIEQRLVQMLQRARRLDDTVVISADREAIVTIRQLDSRVATLSFHEKLLSPETWSPPVTREGNSSRYTHFLFGDVVAIDERSIKRAHDAGIGVLTSVAFEKVVTADLVVRLVRAGVDGVFTNRPAALKEMLRS